MPKENGPAKLVWQELNSSKAEGGIFNLNWNVHRTKVPGGWLVLVIHNTTGLTFLPDPQHQWDGGSLTQFWPFESHYSGDAFQEKADYLNLNRGPDKMPHLRAGIEKKTEG